MIPHGNTNMGQHWLRQWLVAWWHKAITWANVDVSSVGFSNIHLVSISQHIHQQLIPKIDLKNYLSQISFKFSRGQWVNNHMFWCMYVLPRLNELKQSYLLHIMFPCPLHIPKSHVSGLWVGSVSVDKRSHLFQSVPSFKNSRWYVSA